MTSLSLSASSSSSISAASMFARCGLMEGKYRLFFILCKYWIAINSKLFSL
jgi:hypothetical protein